MLGFGEVGSLLARQLSCESITLRAFDPRFAEVDSGPTNALGALPSVVAGVSPEDVVIGSSVVFSAVTADESVNAAKSIRKAIHRHTWFIDLNSVSPGSKERAADFITAGGGRFVECAVMSPIEPLGIASPILASGPLAESFSPIAASLGLTGWRVISSKPGKASAAKMCRSIIIKGIESLIFESLPCARKLGVESEVIDSLTNLLPGIDWNEQSRYMISRTILHGQRRSDEMEQVCTTLEEVGFDSLMSAACVKKQENSARYDALANEKSLTKLLDQLIWLNSNPTQD
ncbi:MAG: DUF1932 domain-containing protein [Pseudomonadota bacterium]